MGFVLAPSPVSLVLLPLRNTHLMGRLLEGSRIFFSHAAIRKGSGYLVHTEA